MLFAFFEAVTFALDVDDGAMVQNAVQNGGGYSDIRKNLAPLRKRFVGREYGRNLFVAAGNELKKQVLPLNIHREIPDFVDDHQGILAKYLELVRQPIFVVCGFELLDEVVTVDVIRVVLPGSR